jgi:hypothetical protein
MIRLLHDEMLSGTIARQLRERGHDVRSIVESAGHAGCSDAEVLELATRDERIVVTLNVADFVTLNVADFVSLDRGLADHGRMHDGIFLVSSRRFPQNASFIGGLVTAFDAAEASGAVPGPGTTRFL